MATGDRGEKEVQQIIIIAEHDTQMSGLLIDCANRTITETSNYPDMDLVMINDEWGKLPVPRVSPLGFLPIKSS